MNNTKRCTQ